MLRIASLIIKSVAIVLVIGSYSLTTWAAWGDYDSTFGFGGYAFDNVTNHFPKSVTMQSDGKILVTGYRTSFGSGNRMFLRRYNTDGTLDTSFGDNGAARVPSVTSQMGHYRGESIVVFLSGKIAVAGYANGFYGVWQFLPGGAADRNYGTDGFRALTNYPININDATPEARNQAGSLLLALKKKVGQDMRVVLLRLSGIGANNLTFGDGGEVVTDFAAATKGYDGMYVDFNNLITIVGHKYYDLTIKAFERRTYTGEIDTSFNPPTTSRFGIISPGLVRMWNGKFITRAAQPSNNPYPMAPYLEKYSSAGIFESALAPVTGNPTGSCPQIFMSQADGKILAHMSSKLLRTSAELSAGMVQTSECTNLSALENKSRAMLQPDDKMITAGVYNNTLVLVRTMPN